jgi:hypothetical protein
MNSATLHQIHIIKQDAKAGTVTKKGLSLLRLVHNLIREHGIYRHGTYYLDVHALPLHDKRLLLSHFESPEWYEYACVSANHTESLFEESADYIQKFVNDECYEVYIDDMEEMRSYK